MKSGSLALALLVAVSLAGCTPPEQPDVSPRARALADLRVLKEELSGLHERRGHWPTNAEGVALLATRPTDPWGRHYQYRAGAGGKRPKVWSLGPDPVATADDVQLKTIAR